MSGSTGRFGSDDGTWRRAGRFVLVMMSGALALVGLTVLSMQNTFAGDAMAGGSKGKQPTAWGPPYPNMPDIVPPNVRATEYGPVSEKDAPPIDPAKGYRVENFGGGVYMVTEGAYQMMLVVSDAGVIVADAPPTIGPKILKAIEEVAPGSKIATTRISTTSATRARLLKQILK
jgi:hypothetical protein